MYPVVTPAELRKTLPADKDVVAFQCRNPIHRAHYELFIRSLTAPNVEEGSVVLVHPTCGPTQEDDIDGVTRCACRAPPVAGRHATAQLEADAAQNRAETHAPQRACTLPNS